MKKYVSFLSLITIFLLQSCEIDNTNSDINVSKKESTTNKKIVYQTEDKKSLNKTVINPVENNAIDAIEEEEKEPKKDKSHWRAKYDTIWY